MRPADHRRDGLELTFRGVRGSVCAPGEKTVRYGGNTTCLEIRLATDCRLLLDCGSGLRSLQSSLPPATADRELHFHVLLTHYHRDHIEGLTFFEPLYDPNCHFTFYGLPWRDIGVEQALDGMRPPWSPVPFHETPSRKSFKDLSGGDFEIGPIGITTARLRHPQGATAYRLNRNGRSIVFATDTEHGDARYDDELRSLSRDADVLIHDAQYTTQEYEKCRGHGHSTWEDAVGVAHDSNAKRLILFHHDPNRSDDELDAIVSEARARIPGVDAAREGMSVSL